MPSGRFIGELSIPLRPGGLYLSSLIQEELHATDLLRHTPAKSWAHRTTDSAQGSAEWEKVGKWPLQQAAHRLCMAERLVLLRSACLSATPEGAGIAPS